MFIFWFGVFWFSRLVKKGVAISAAGVGQSRSWISEPTGKCGEGLGADFQGQRELFFARLGLGGGGPHDQLLWGCGGIEEQGNFPTFAGKLGLPEADAVRCHLDLDLFAMLLVLGISREELEQFCRTQKADARR